MKTDFDTFDVTRVWAGDRFDIRPFNAVDFEEDGEVWKDVSEEVAAEVFEVWEAG